ncbi:MAG: DHH family phosphoesterase [Candidatus Bostrichicola ureolyticus]|nr:MAG: DHH family phosphoesterase [Candidatus Bostrichicola ureolyticus]
MDDLKKIFKSLKKKITLLSHRNPDGDAIGSSLAMFLYLKKLNHDVCMILPTNYPNFLKWLPNNEDFIIYSEKNKIVIKEKIIYSDIIIFIDFHDLYRIKPIDIFLQESKAIKMLIDHHDNFKNYDFFDLKFYDPTASSTSIIIFRIINSMGDFNHVDRRIATCLYVSLVTDTGSFRFSYITPETHYIAYKLLETGIDISYVNNRIYSIYTKYRMFLLGKTLQNVKIISLYRTAYTIINAYDLKYYNNGDTEGFVNYGLDIKNIVFSLIFIENLKFIKISFRSKGNFDVNAFAKKHFSGGGHKNAAGGIYYKSLNETIKYFLSILPIYKKILQRINL